MAIEELLVKILEFSLGGDTVYIDYLVTKKNSLEKCTDDIK